MISTIACLQKYFSGFMEKGFIPVSDYLLSWNIFPGSIKPRVHKEVGTGKDIHIHKAHNFQVVIQ